MTKYGEEDLDILTTDPGLRTPPQRMRKPSPIVAVLKSVLHLVIPVAALLGMMLFARYAEGTPVTAFDRYPSDQAERNLSAWLTSAHFVIPLTFFVIHLTNRAYGAGIALGQVLIAWTALAVGTIYFAEEVTGVLPWWQMPPQAPSLAASLLAGHLVAVVVFEMTRGPNWWKAPLYAGLFGSAVYVGLLYTLAPPGPEIPLSLALGTDGTINFLTAVLLLLPYWMLRPLIQPLPGYGGA